MSNMSNFNHFTGKKSPIGRRKTRKKKIKKKSVHTNKYEKLSKTSKQPKWTNGY